MPKIVHSHKFVGAKVTAKQEVFCQELVRTGAVKKSSQLAYPDQKPTHAHVQGNQNLLKPAVIERLQQIKAEVIDLMSKDPNLSLPALVRHTSTHILATKEVMDKDGQILTLKDNETQAKAQDRAYKLYGLMDKYSIESPQIQVTFQADPEKLRRIEEKLSRLSHRQGFQVAKDKGVTEAEIVNGV